ncbi:MAG: Stp1/IreP family PP2C-type Ser/Thr phosphatase [Clostridia bacterium]|nr:Stp1/IreP family PP2C-type Ser/Thr phosphatase [Clostridia bacterium]
MKYFALTDVGMVRELNEDTYLVKEYGDATLFAVFDGMGGANAGEMASAMARDEVEKYFDNFFASFSRTEPAAIQAALASAADRANFKIFSLAKSDKAYEGMGTTMVAALYISDKVYVAHIGDSRAYLIDKDGAYQITRDHSFVQYLVDIGKLTPEEAKTSSQKNIITRAVGVDKEVSVDVSVLEQKQYKNRTLLLCSDGLSNYIGAGMLCDLCKTYKTPEELCKVLVATANEAGGHDNITAVVAKLK